MAEFTYQTRRRLSETWLSTLKAKSKFLSGREQKMLPELSYYIMPQDACNFMRQLLYSGKYTTLSELYRKQFPNLVDVCVRKAWQEDFYYALDQMNSYQMTAGRPQAFLHLFSVIEDNNLIRYSSVKRAVSTWIGIFDEKSIDRIRDKLLRLMGQKGR